MTEDPQLDRLFYPDSVAVIGASRNPEKIGHLVLRNLALGGFECCVYPVNPNADHVLGMECLDSVTDVPREVDLAVVAVPASIVPGVLEECAEKGVAGAVIISGGFSETGNDELSRKVEEVVETTGLRVVGPNTLGIINTENGLNASFASGMPLRGDIAFVTQSGALGGALIHWTQQENLGLSKVVAMGNKLDLDDAETLRYLASKEEVEVVALYMEGLDNGREFMEAAESTVEETPVVAVKSGHSSAGERAATSHTGALAGQDRVFDAAMRQSGVIRADTTVELFDMAEALTLQPPATGNRVGIVTNGGGAGVVTADSCETRGLQVPELSDETKERIADDLPEIASPRNPVDTLGDAGYDRYASAIDALNDSGEVDAVIALHVQTSQIDPTGAARAVAERAQENGIPVVSCWIGGEGLTPALEEMRERGVPHYPDPDRAVSAVHALARQGDNLG